MTFSEKIKARREELRLNQEQLADLCGVSRRTIISCETTERKPYASTVRKIAAGLGVTVYYLEHDEVDDPQAGIEQEPYVEEARVKYGKKGAEEMARVLEQNEALFAGGILSEEQKDMFFEAVSRAYFSNKQHAREKFGPKSRRPGE